ncbi:MAG: PCRF domain-containing protein, partial [Bifidobacteriales bacterium]|nr:PCRF domain-containing protein [Bifidobacteriales bacterium]
MFDWDAAKTRLAELNHLAEDPELWNNPDAAQKMMRERTMLANQIEGVEALETEVQDTLDLVELAEMENDEAVVQDGLTTLRALAAQAQQRETESLLSGEADGNDCYLEVNSGAGGTEAQDWAEMLLRMYTR